MRLIDADALIESLSKNCPEDTMAEAIVEIFKACVDNEPIIETEPQWIPCSERLPEEGKEVLVTCRQGRFAFTAEGKFACRFGGWASAWNNGDLPDVVAWMPEPEPWRGDV